MNRSGVEQLEARRAHNPEVAGSSPAPATTVVDVARSQLGVVESGDNGGVPFERYALRGEQPLAWCARFVRWCFAQTGVPLPGNHYEIGRVAYLVGELQDAGAWLGRDVEPLPGDLVFLAERGGSDPGPGHHVGIVEECDGRRVYSIDGNWANGVRRVTRELGDPTILGFARWPAPA